MCVYIYIYLRTDVGTGNALHEQYCFSLLTCYASILMSLELFAVKQSVGHFIKLCLFA